MKLGIIANPNAPHQLEAARLLECGVGAHRVDVSRYGPKSEHLKTSAMDAFACWGWRLGAQIRAWTGRPVLVMERGYLGDRFVWTSLHWDGLNGHGRFHFPDDDGDRWRAIRDRIPKPAPHRPTGRREGFAVIMGQVRGDMSIAGVNIEAWYEQAAECARGHGYSPRFRPHPLSSPFRSDGNRTFPDCYPHSLERTLEIAAVVYAFNSNSLTDAAMAGVPIVCGDRGAVAWDIGGQGVAAVPRLEGRAQWLHRMAWRQWLPSEIECGHAWAAIRQAMLEGSPNAVSI